MASRAAPAKAPANDTLDSEVTRVVHAPVRPLVKTDLPTWDDQTEESAGPSKTAPPEERTDLTVNLPRAPQQSSLAILADGQSRAGFLAAVREYLDFHPDSPRFPEIVGLWKTLPDPS